MWFPSQKSKHAKPKSSILVQSANVVVNPSFNILKLTGVKRVLNLLEERGSRIPSPIKTIPFKHLNQKYIDSNLFHLSMEYIVFCLD